MSVDKKVKRFQKKHAEKSMSDMTKKGTAQAVPRDAIVVEFIVIKYNRIRYDFLQANKIFSCI